MKTIMQKLRIVTFAGLLLVPYFAFAHPGNTDSSGGHYCRTNCSQWGYSYGEYHSPKKSISTAVAELEIVSQSLSSTPFTLGASYKNPDAGFTFKMPKGWELVEDTQEGLVVELLHESGVNINVAAVETADSLAKVVKDSKAAFPLLFENYKKTKDKKYTFKGAKARLLGSRYFMNDVYIQNLQLLVVKKGKLYVMTGTGFDDNWEQTEKFFMKVFKSFKVL